MNHKYTLLLSCCLLLLAQAGLAGNPDRQGEAGANQLLINPWARSAGLHTMNTSSVSGGDAMFLNVAGLARIQKTQIQVNHARYIADINMNALAFGQRVGRGGAFGIALVAMDLGEFLTTAENTPEGSGGTFSPSYFNMGISYSHLFANKVSVGVTFKFVNESISNVGARAMALDAGVQYVTGPKDNFKFGISLRNVGNKMRFVGEGLSKQRPSPNGTFDYPVTYYERSAAYELPSQLNIGMSYDWVLGRQNRLSLIGNFCSNAFSRDQVGGGLEFSLGKNFALRAAYKTEMGVPSNLSKIGAASDSEATLDNGIAAGFTASLPVRKDSDTRLTLDYAYRTTAVFNGIHNIGVRIDL
jgi:hypothetical protein